MELAELLESEGLDPDELIAWAKSRAESLVAELGHAEQGRPLLQLLERDASLDVAAVSVAAPERVAIVEAPPKRPEPVASTHPPREEFSGLQPIIAHDLPPPPEPSRLVDGEPEPMLETFDTGAIQLGTPEADALIAQTSTSSPRPEPEPVVETESTEDEESGEDELEELELDELVELDDEELVELDDEPEPPSPPPPPSSSDEAPVQTGDTAAFPVVEQSDEADEPKQADDDFDLDFDD